MNKDNGHYDRVDRVDGVNAAYKDAVVRLKIQSEIANTYNGQVMAILASNLLSRWAKRVIVGLPTDVDCIISKYKGSKLKQVLEGTMAKGRTGFEYSFNESEEYMFSLSIGCGADDNTVWVNCDGWLAGFGYNENDTCTPGANCVLGASFAACLGVSEIFRQAIGASTPPFKKWFSLYDYSSAVDHFELPNPIIPEIIELGTVHQVGCGAIGSSFDFILSLTNDISVKIFLIDHDHVEDHNQAASLVFTPTDVREKIQKVDACFREFEPGGSVEPYPNDYSHFISNGKYREHVPDLILCFANERNIWSTIQQKCPPLSYHATTTKNWGTNFGRHAPQKDWCLMCRFGSEVKQITRTFCSEGNISQEPAKEVLGVLPFVAPASAIVALSSLYKINDHLYMNTPSFIQFSMKNISGQFSSLTYPGKKCATCASQDLSIYPQYVKETLHWSLSE